jgi:hypothetical protein
MKHVIRLVAALALAGAAFAQVNPQRPMVTGRGNVDARPGKVAITNQTAAPAAAPADDAVKLDKFEVTGSLLPKAPAPAKR